MSLDHTPFFLKNQVIDPIEMPLLSHQGARNGCTQKVHTIGNEGRNCDRGTSQSLYPAHLVYGFLTTTPNAIDEGVRMPSYREQYDRMNRWYERFSSIDRGRSHEIPSDHYAD